MPSSLKISSELSQPPLKSIAALCMAPVATIWLIAFALIFVATGAHAYRESQAVIAREMARIQVTLPLITRSVAAELLVGDRRSAELLAEHLREENNFQRLFFSESDDGCPDGSNSPIAVVLGYGMICSVAAIPAVTPKVSIVIVSRPELNPAHAIVSAVCLTLLPLILIAVVSVVLVQKTLKNSVVLPVRRLQQEIVNRIPDFLTGAEEKFEIRENFGSQELTSLARALGDVVFHLKETTAAKNKLEVEHKTATAVASMLQMVVHDVRKPFTLFRVAVNMLDSAQSSKELFDVKDSIVSELQVAMNQVEGLIQDLMEANSSSKLFLELVDARDLVESALRFAIPTENRQGLSAIVDCPASVKLQVDKIKMHRVLTNIISNAAQAMNFFGRIEICVTEIQKPGGGEHVLRIWNENSFISAEDIDQVFESFFTKGKRGGTGLGLAIAKKIVDAHQGRISCLSWKDEVNPNGAVEFRIVLPGSAKC